MFKVDSDITKNRLYITLENLATEDVNPILEELSNKIAKLSSGFTCLVDIRTMSLDPITKGSEYIEIVQGALADSGMRKVVRLISKGNPTFHTRMEDSSTHLSYIALPAYSYEEAEMLLDEN